MAQTEKFIGELIEEDQHNSYSNIINVSNTVLESMGVPLGLELLERAARLAVAQIIRHWVGGIADPLINMQAFSSGLKEVTNGEIYIKQTDLDPKDPKIRLNFAKAPDVIGDGGYCSAYVLIDAHTSNFKPYIVSRIIENLIVVTNPDKRNVTTMTIPEALQKFHLSEEDYEHFMSWRYIFRNKDS